MEILAKSPELTSWYLVVPLQRQSELTRRDKHNPDSGRVEVGGIVLASTEPVKGAL